MLPLERGFEPIELATDEKIRMLEQLNRTLELLQAAQEIFVDEELTLRQKVEQSVLTAILLLCTPLVAVKETAAPAEQQEMQSKGL